MSNGSPSSVPWGRIPRCCTGSSWGLRKIRPQLPTATIGSIMPPGTGLPLLCLTCPSLSFLGPGITPENKPPGSKPLPQALLLERTQPKRSSDFSWTGNQPLEIGQHKENPTLVSCAANGRDGHSLGTPDTVQSGWHQLSWLQMSFACSSPCFGG